MNWESIKTAILQTGIKVVLALIILIVAFKIINLVFRKLKATLDKAGKLDSMLIKALIDAGRWLVKILVVIALVGYLGIDTTGFAALIASLGVALGLAVNGTLSNLAGGVLLLATHPFKIGDYISVAGFEGTMDDLKVVSTKLITLDNKVVYVPNGVVSTSAVTNYTALDIRRVDL
ncbi:mechanosensitive ion channel, partial [bacterium]|nr:mechanosensitive ion channel [bacterium]